MVGGTRNRVSETCPRSGLPDRHVMVSNHRRIDPDLDPRQRRMGSVDGPEGSFRSFEHRTRHPMRHRPVKRREPSSPWIGGRTLVLDRVEGDKTTPEHVHPEPPQQAPQPAKNPRLCVIRCLPELGLRRRSTRLGHQFPEPGQP